MKQQRRTDTPDQLHPAKLNRFWGKWPAVKKVLPLIEAKLAPFGVRPHWTKMFTMQPSDIQKQYEKLPDYQAMLKHYDPNGKFRNDFLNTNLFGA